MRVLWWGSNADWRVVAVCGGWRVRLEAADSVYEREKGQQLCTAVIMAVAAAENNIFNLLNSIQNILKVTKKNKVG